jgi:hypothetical protein
MGSFHEGIKMMFVYWVLETSRRMPDCEQG